MSTVIHAVQRGNAERQPRWERTQRAALLDQYRVLPAEGLSQRQAAKTLHMPRTTRHAWHVWQERLEACPQGVALFESGPGLAFLHRLVMALHVVFVELGAGGLRLVCRFLELTALHRFVGASYGTQHQVHRRVEEASVADRQEASTRLARAMPAQDMTRTQDATFTGGLCLVGIEPGSHYMRLEQVAPARDHDTWQARMAPALAGLHCQGIQATSAEAPGLLAYVDHHLGVHHAPDLFPGQHALRKAVSARMAAKQRAAAKAVMQAATALHQAQEHLHTPPGEPEKCDPECPCEAAAPLAKVEQDVAAARQAHHRLARQREQVTQRIRAMGHAYHFVDLKRGVRRTGTRIAGDIQQHSDTIRTMAQQEHLSEACLDRMAKAERGVPTMQATIEFVSGDVRQQGRQLPLPLPVSYAMHAPLLPSYALERVAATQTVTAGEPWRALAECLRTALVPSAGALGALSPVEHAQLKAKAKTLAEVFQRSSSNVEGRNGDRSLRNHQLRGLDYPRKRACLTAMHNCCLTRADGTTAAARFFGPKPRSMFAAILASVEIPPAPLSPPRRAAGETGESGVAGAVIEALLARERLSTLTL